MLIIVEIFLFFFFLSTFLLSWSRFYFIFCPSPGISHFSKKPRSGHSMYYYFLNIVYFANIFSYSVACLFILLMVSLAVQKLLNLIRSYLFMFAFVSFKRQIKKKMLHNLCQSVLPESFSRSFVVSSIIFRSLIHFEFIFVYGIRGCCDLILLHVAVQISQHHLLKRLSFLHCVFLLSFFAH